MTAREVTVQLPEPEGPDSDGQLFFLDYDLRVDLTGGSSEPPAIWWQGREISPRSARSIGLEFLAAAEIAAGGAA